MIKKAKSAKTVKAGTSVKGVIAALGDEQTISDSRTLMQIMRRISGRQPKLWNVGTIGFDEYHYQYESGREGDGHALGFYPRKGKITVYLMDGTARHSKLLARLGKHTTSRACVHIKRLEDVELPILEKILEQSYRYLKAHSGQMHRVE
jgi:hypothetical protein